MQLLLSADAGDRNLEEMSGDKIKCILHRTSCVQYVLINERLFLVQPQKADGEN